MIYKYKVLFNNTDSDKTNICKIFDLDDKHKLYIKVDLEKEFNIVLSILNHDNKVIAKRDFYFSNEKKVNRAFKIYRTYKMISEENPKDMFMIKIFPKDIMNITNVYYNPTYIKNEIRFTNVKNKFELIDLCIFMLSQEFNTDRLIETKDIFVEKILHFGYKSLKELISDKDLSDNLQDVIVYFSKKYKTEDAIDYMSEIFCKMVFVYFENNNLYNEDIWNIISNYNNNLGEERLKYLEPYFIF